MWEERVLKCLCKHLNTATQVEACTNKDTSRVGTSLLVALGEDGRHSAILEV